MAAMNLTRRIRSSRGAELVEFALVLPLLLLLVLGIIDFGLLFHRYEAVTNAAREGARVAILPGYATADVQARVARYIADAGLPGTPSTTVIAPTGVDVGGGTCITMTGATVTYPNPYLLIGGIMAYFGHSGFSSKTLTATSMMRYEAGSVACP